MSGPKILAFGEVLWDLLPSGPVLGGAPCNFAFRASEVGAQSKLISAIGNDQLGQDVLTSFEKLSITPEFLHTAQNKQTGIVKVTIDEGGNPSYEICEDVAWDFIQASQVALDWSSQCDCICYGSLAQRNEVSRQTLKKVFVASPQSLKLLDINLRDGFTDISIIKDSIQSADILKLNGGELSYIAKIFGIKPEREYAIAQLIDEYSLQSVVVTLGEHGAYYQTKDNESDTVKGVTTNVIDLVGAGDAFAAGFIVKHLSGSSMKEACKAGNILGAGAAASVGATTSISDTILSTW